MTELDNKQCLYKALNDTKAKFANDMAIHELFYEQVVKHPHLPAVSDGVTTLTYQDLNERSNQVAHLLIEQGVTTNQIVGILMERSVKVIVVMLGVLKAGAAYVPIDPEYPMERVCYMVEDSQATLLLTQQNLLNDLPTSNCRVIFFEDISVDFSTANPNIRNSSADLAYVIYTSGSTGRPKGTLLRHVGVSNLAKWKQEEFGYSEADSVLQFASFSFDASVWEVFPALLNGASLHLLMGEQRQSIEAFANAVAHTGATTVTLPTAFFNQISYYLSDAEITKFSSLKRIFVAGEALQSEVVRGWQRRFDNRIEIINAYGPTESTVCATVYRIENRIPDDQLYMPIGRPISNTEIYILNDDLQLCAVNEIGELHIASVGLASGYLNQPEKTVEVFIPHPFSSAPGAVLYKSGDLARLLPDGNIEFVGRKDTQVKVRGHRIETGEVEEVLLQHVAVEMAVVVAQQEADGNNTLIAFYTSSQTGIGAAELRRFLERKLPNYMVPTWMERLDELPLTPNGKIDRKALIQKIPHILQSTRHYEAPATELEAKLAGVWTAVLKKEPIGRTDHFFELGGHSLLAMQVINRIRDSFRIKVELKDLFSFPTLQEFAIFVGSKGDAGGIVQIARVPKQEQYELSNAQKRLWFLYQMDPTSKAYNLPANFVITGKLNARAFEQSLQYLVKRHASLRTVFVERDGKPFQVVNEESGFCLVCEDLTGLNRAAQQEYIREKIRASESVPFDLTTGPLMRAMLFTLGDEVSYFYLNMHHIITDGWSHDLLMKELSDCYRDFQAGGHPQLQEIGLQYVDYAHWQEQELKNGLLDHELTYWLDTLAKPLPVLELPTDFSRPEVQTFHGDLLISSVPQVLLEPLRTVARREGVSLYMLLLTAYSYVLHYLTQDEDIIVGTPSAGRTTATLEHVIGFFVNTLAIRIRFDQVQTLQDLLRVVKSQTLNAYEHQSYPFDLLIEKLNPERDSSRSPIFSTMFVHQEASRYENKVGELDFQLQIDGVDHSISKFDLLLSMIEGKSDLRFTFEYNTDLFKRETLERFSEILVNVLQAFTTDLQTPVHTLDLLPEVDRALYGQLNDTAAAYDLDKTIPQMFYEAVAKFPNYIALSSEEGEMTYTELNERSNQVARMLIERGVQKGDFIGIVMGRCMDTVVSLMGIMKAGGVYVPIDPEYPEDRIRYQIADSGAPYIITQKQHLEKLQSILDANQEVGSRFKATLLIDESLVYPTGDVELITTADDLCYVIYTSGSTGRPKGALLAHRGIINLVEWARDKYEFGEDDVVLEFASYSFDASVWDTFVAILLGGRSHLLTTEQRLSIEEFANAVEQSQATTVMIMAVFFKQMATYLTDEDYEKLRSMKVIYVTGEVLSAEVLRLWQRRFGTEIVISNAGGPTECTVYVGAYDAVEMLGEEYVNVPIGKPLSNYKMYILNDKMQQLPVNVTGEIYIETLALSKGYLNQPEKTAEVFLPNPFVNGSGPVFNSLLYKTGDLGKLLSDGNVEILGRKDHQIKVRGYRIEMGEIETVILQHPEVEVAAVIASKAVDGSNTLFGFFTTTTSTSQLGTSEIKSFIAQKLPDFMVPQRIIRLDAMPLSPTGKVDRKALGKMAAEDTCTLESEFIEPSTDSERKLASIWSEILKQDQVSANDNFFELGGHSLLATQVSNRIHKELGAKLELKDLFLYPTLFELAGFIDSLLQSGTEYEATTRIPRAVVKQDYVLSNAQKRLWFLYKFNPASRVYNIPVRARVKGKADVRLLDTALQQVVMRHPSLRTVFVERNGEVRQVVQADSQVCLLHEDLRSVDPDMRTALLEAKIQESDLVPFDLTQGPLLRAMLFTVTDEESYLYLSMHHIITDGWSNDVLLKEFAECYRAAQQGEQPQLAPLGLEYVDYAEWQEQELADGRWTQEESYWLSTLAKPLPVLELPTDFARPEIQTYNGEYLTSRVPAEIAEQLRVIARQENVSMYILLLTAHVMFLHHLTQGDDLIVGTPVAGRTVEDLEPLVGFFVNTLAIRTQMEGVQSFQGLLHKVKQQTLDALENQAYPFDVLIEKINPPRDTSRSPIFTNLFVYQNVENPQLQMGQLQLQLDLDAMDRTISKFDLSVYMTEEENHLHCGIEFNTDLFRADTVARFAEIFLNILRSMTLQWTTPIASLDLLTSADRAVYAQMNDTAVEYDLDQLLLDAFIEQAESNPERVALMYDGQVMTYGELHERSNRLAHFLREQGVQRNQLVAIMMERGLEMMVGLYAIVKSGGAYVPIDPEYPAQRVQYMITDSQASVLLSKQKYAEQIAGIAQELEQLNAILYLDETKQAETPDIAGVTAYAWSDLHDLPTTTPETVNVPDDLAYMIYTSGSTGQPKGATISHRAIVNRLLWHQDQFQATPADVIAQRTSVCFDVSVWELFWAMRHGAKLSILPSDVVKDPYRMHAQLVQDGVTVMHFVPSLFTAFVTAVQGLPDAERVIKAMRWIVTSGEALPVKTVNLWFEKMAPAAPIANLYGPTEAAVDVSSWIIEGEQDHILIGKPIANTQLYVLDPYGNPCPVNVKGELHIGGVQLATGYHNKPEKTAEVFIPNHLPGTPGDRLYRTGDLARILPDGNIEYLGRIDNQVKVRGFRIEMGEIEEVLTQHPDVEMAGLIVRKGPDDNNALFAFYTASRAELPVSELREYLGQKLPDYMVPSRLQQIEQMPLSPNGKLDRKVLAQWAAEDVFIKSREYKAPSTPTEQRLAQIWQDVLKIEQISVDDNFFELGGHSLLAMQIFNRIHHEFQADVELKDLFTYPTLGTLSAHVDLLLRSGERTEVIQIPRSGGRGNYGEHYGLSNAQKRLWFLQKFDPTSTVYNVPKHVRVKGRLDVSSFEKALEFLGMRHFSLRTIFIDVAGTPRQVVAPIVNFRLVYEDLRGMSKEEQNQTIKQAIAESEAVPFNLMQGPLVRAKLFTLNEEESYFYLCMHHIITDGWSGEIFVRDLMQMYHSITTGEELRLVPIQHQYVDFAEWQQKELKRGRWDTEEQYWLEVLEKPLPVLNLPTDYPRLNVQTYQGELLMAVIPKELTERLRELAYQNGMSLYMVLLSAYLMLLHHFTTDEDIVVGTPVAGRTVGSLEPIIGFFVNTLAIRVRFDDVLTVQDLLEMVKRQVLEAFANQSYPFDLLIEKINPERDTSRSPVFSTMFMLETGSAASTQMGELLFEPILETGDHSISKFDLSLMVLEEEEFLNVGVEYNTDLFTRETIERVASGLIKVLTAFVEHTAVSVHQLDLLTDVDRAVYDQLNDTQSELAAHCTIHELFYERAKQYADQIAISDEHRSFTYQELNERSNQIAHVLRERGIAANQIVGILMERSVNGIVAMLGALKAGAAYAMIDPEYPEDRVRYMLEDSNISLLITSRNLEQTVDSEQLELLYIEEVPNDACDEDLEITNTVDDLAYVIYTSGSTGRPKGVLLKHVGVINLVQWKREVGFTEHDTVLQFISHSFDASVGEIFPALLNGARLHILSHAQRQSAEAFADVVAKIGATTATIVPTMLNQLVTHLSDEDFAKLHGLKQVIVGGEALQPELVRAWHRRIGTGVPIYNEYGPTEATVTSTIYRVDQVTDDQVAIPIGSPVPNYEIYILNQQMQLCPVKVVGEVYIGGIGLAKGYLNQPDKTAEVFIPHPFAKTTGAMLYRTGDLARLLPNGMVEYVGRRDEQVKIRGHRVELSEIEEVILEHPSVQSCAVVTQKTAGGDNLLASFYTVHKQLETDELKQFISRRVPDYMVPTRLYELDVLPLTPNGKVDRKQLTRMAEDELWAFPQEHVTPSTPTEEKLAAIWSEVLGRGPISAKDNFFELGGHSLLATRVFNLIQREIHVILELKDLFAYPTLKALAEHIDVLFASGKMLPAMKILPAPKQGHYPLSNVQKRMWFLYQFDPTSRAYDVPGHFTLQGQIDVALFEQTVRTLVDRHSSLRTIFIEVDEQPRQVILETSTFGFEYHDLSGVTDVARQREMWTRIEQSARVPFGLSKGSLMRVMLFKLEEEKFFLYLNLHHIITDGWSMDILTKELLEIYSQLAQGGSIQLPPVTLQYVDYAVWQERQLKRNKWSKEEEYWLTTLSKPLPVLELPLDYTRPQIQTYNGSSVLTQLSKELVEQLHAVAKKEDVSLYMLMMSAYGMFLHYLTQQDDIIVGTPVAGRIAECLEPIVGPFINTLAIRMRFDGVATLQDLLQAVKYQTLEAFEHQVYPFDLLIEKVNPERDASRTPIFSTLMLYQSADWVEEKTGHFNLQAVADEKRTISKFDLTVAMVENEAGMHVGFEYNVDLFKEETIHRFVEIFHLVVEAFVADLSSPLGTLNLLGTADRVVYEQLNDTRVNYDLEQLLHEGFVKQAEAYPERVALSYEGKTMTYGELHERSNQLAHFLRAKGVKRNQFVGLMVERSFEMMVGLYGILKAGAAYVPIDPEYPEQRIQYMMSDSKTTILLTKSGYAEQIAAMVDNANHLSTVLYLDDTVNEELLTGSARTLYTWSDIQVQPTLTLSVINESTDLCYMIYTSGSTGQPKGVTLSHRAVVNSLSWMQEKYALTERDVVSQRTSFCFDTSVWELFWTLREGAKMAILATDVVKDQNLLYQKLVEERVTVVNFAPSLFAAFAFALENMEQAQREQLTLRWVLLAGEAAQQSTVNLWYDMFPSGAQLVNLYGPTEAAITVTSYIIEGKQTNSIPIGGAMPNVQLYVLSPQGALCPVGVQGELYIGGMQLAEGYHNKPEKTAEAFLPNHLPGTPGDRLYRTGDLVRLTENGIIEYLGRIDNQVKVRGFRIELGEIEEVLTLHPDVDLAGVVVRKGVDGNNALFAFYTTDHAELDAAELKEFLGESLPDYMVPARLQKLDVMPLTPSGKMDRKTLSKWAEEDVFALEREYVAPSTETERKLADIWSEVLQLESVSATDHFFELGGHSLLAIQIFNRIQRELQAKIQIKDLFTHPTLRELAAFVDEMQNAGVVEIATPISKAPKRESYPLSNTQKRLWFMYRFDPTNVAYRVPVNFTVTGSLDVEAFEQALQFMVMRHDSLRTVFAEVDGVPCQIIQEQGHVMLRYEELRITDRSQQLAYVRGKIEASEAIPFDLTQGPLIRVMLFRLTDHEWYFYMNIHHIITDGWSQNVFMRELSDVYASLVSGQTPQLAPLDIQYVDYALWLNQEMENDRFKQEEAYWLDTLAKPLPVLALPTDCPRPDMQTFNGDLVPFVVSDELSARLREVASQEGTTLFAVLMAAYVLLLQTVTQDDDIIVGTPVAGRTDESLESVIGFFANTLAIRTRTDGVHTLRELLHVVKKQVLNAFDHQSYPFDLLIEKINPERDPSRTPIFSTMFIYGSASSEQFIDGLVNFQVTDELVEHTISKFDLSINVVEVEGSLQGGFEFNTDLFKKETVQRFVDSFSKVIHAFAEQLMTPIGSLNLLADIDREVYTKMNDTQAEFPADRTIGELFEAQVAVHRDRVAVSDESISLTYRQLNERANQVAHFLRQRGVAANQIVGIMMNRSVQVIVAMLGVLKAGAGYMPVDPEYPESRIRYMLEDSGTTLVLTTQECVAALPDGQHEVVCLEEIPFDLSSTNPSLQHTPEDLAYVIYTSGSTGQPKGTQIRHVGVANMASWKRSEFAYGEEDTVLQFMSHSFDASVQEIYPALLNGARLQILSKAQRQSVEAYAEVVQRTEATIGFMPTVFFRQFAFYLTDEDFVKLKSLKRIFVGGEALPAEVVREWQRRSGGHMEIVNSYGPTETTVCATVYRISHTIDEDIVSLPIGSPLPNTQLYVLNRWMQPSPVNVVGEICIAGVGLSTGYLNQPEKTAEVFVPHPFSSQAGAMMYKTGDMGRLLPDGTIEFVGRQDAQVKVRGHRIEVGEIEEVLLQHPEVELAAVIAEKSVDGVTRLLAYYSGGRELQTDEIRQFLTKKLPDYMIPSRFCWLAQMPLSPNGKIDRKNLPKFDDLMKEDQYVAPRNELEQTILLVWEQCIKHSKIGVEDNFFNLGGDSIVSMQVVSRLTQAGLSVKTSDLFKYQTIAELAAYIEANGLFKNIASASDEPVVGEVLLSPIQHRMFALDVDHEFYFMPVYLDISKKLDPQLLQRSLQMLVNHHDLLRAVYQKGQDGATQTILHSDEVPVELLTYDLSNLPLSGRLEEQTRIEWELKKAIRFEKGVLMKAALLKFDDDSYHLMWILHHLIADIFSIRVLVFDLIEVYEKLERGEQASLPHRTTSFAEWVQQSVDFANSERGAREFAYWQPILQHERHGFDVPIDFLDGKNRITDNQHVSVQFDQQTTTTLLSAVHAAYGTNIKEILLSAVLRAVSEWTLQKRVVIEVEGHGRDQFEGGSFDLSRTVGWFTCMYPFAVNFEHLSLSEQIVQVRDRLRAVPNGGVGLGMLQFLSKEKAVQEAFVDYKRPEIMYNFFGQFDNVQTESTAWRMTDGHVPQMNPDSETNETKLVINGAIMDSCLTMNFIYSTQQYRRTTIEVLANLFEGEMQKIISECVSAKRNA